MARWDEVRAQAPELVAMAEERFAAHGHKTVATLRSDGSPRISGTELPIQQGDVWLAGMVGARRFADLRRDPRVAVHSGSDDPDRWQGDAKIAGRAIEVTDPAGHAAFRGTLDQDPPGGGFELFRVDVTELVVVRLNDAKDTLVIEVWRSGAAGVRRFER